MKVLDKILQALSGDFFTVGSMIDVSSAGIVTEKDKFFTQEGISKIYQINQMKSTYTLDFISTITKRISNLNEENPLKVKIYYEINNTSVSINTPAFVSRMNKSTEDFIKYKKEYSELPPELQESGIYQDNGVHKWSFTKKDILKKKHRYDSFVDVNNHIRDDRGKYFLVTVLITVVYKNLIDYKAYEEQVFSILVSETTLTTKIEKNIGTLLANLSPSTMCNDNVQSSSMLLSEENLTHLIPFRREGIISSRGIPLATNIGNNTPLFLDLFSSPDGSATLIEAKAGKGKSTLGYTYTLQNVAAETTVIYIDIKGKEVTECLSKAMDSIKKIDFSEKSKLIYNTMHLNKFIPSYGVSDAIKVTSEMLSIFVSISQNEGNEVDVLMILRHAIRSYYNSMNIVEGALDTYYLSEQMTYSKLLEFIGSQLDSDKEERLKSVFGIITDRLGEAFLTYNMSNNDNSIDLFELFRYSVIVFAFNKSNDASTNKSETTSLSIIDQVRIYMVLTITKRVSSYNKENETFTNLMCEEGNQYAPYTQMCKGISDLASGSRSENLTVTFITNNLEVLLLPSLSGLKNNITNFIIGISDASAVTILKENFLKPELALDVSRIIRDPAKFERAFAIHFEMGDSKFNAIARCDLPKSVSDMFRTRTVVG